MSHEMQVRNFIDQNNWGGLAHFLKFDKGFIHPIGGRCIGGKYVEFDGYSDFNAVCWSIFEKCADKIFLKTELTDVSSTIVELDRIYNETQTKLKACSVFIKFSTAMFDCSYQQCVSGFSSLDRLKEFIVDPGKAQQITTNSFMDT